MMNYCNSRKEIKIDSERESRKEREKEREAEGREPEARYEQILQLNICTASIFE